MFTDGASLIPPDVLCLGAAMAKFLSIRHMESKLWIFTAPYPKKRMYGFSSPLLGRGICECDGSRWEWTKKGRLHGRLHSAVCTRSPRHWVFSSVCSSLDYMYLKPASLEVSF